MFSIELTHDTTSTFDPDSKLSEPIEESTCEAATGSLPPVLETHE
jgi:hypothetical protein